MAHVLSKTNYTEIIKLFTCYDKRFLFPLTKEISERRFICMC
jgi:hypothetical protein